MPLERIAFAQDSSRPGPQPLFIWLFIVIFIVKCFSGLFELYNKLLNQTVVGTLDLGSVTEVWMT